MTIALPTPAPEETARQDIRSKYKAEYERAARGGKAMTRREMGLVALFGVSMFTMMGLSLVPAMPLLALVVPSVLAITALVKADNTAKAITRQALAAIDRDIENGTLLPRYRQDLFGGPEVSMLRAKFTGLRRLSKAFADKAAQPAPVVTTAAPAGRKPAGPQA